MNKKLIFRILGSVAAAMIVVSVFLPFISRSGYSSSLWENYKSIDSLYLPIMLIVFGVIALVPFLINKKTEFAYMSTGAVLFFVIMTTIDISNQKMFNYLSIGYYLLFIGAILTGVMTFLTNVSSKNKKVISETTTASSSEPSVLEQIDRLYNSPQDIEPVQQMTYDPAVTPVSNVNPIENLNNTQSSNLSDLSTNASLNSVESIPEIVPLGASEVKPAVNPVLEQFSNLSTESKPTVAPVNSVEVPNVAEVQSVSPTLVEQTNPVLSEFPQSPKQEPINFNTNPVLSQFSASSINEPVQSKEKIAPINSAVEPKAPNPVLEQFADVIESNQAQLEANSMSFGIAPRDNTSQAPAQAPQPTVQNGPVETDIFGQPINK